MCKLCLLLNFTIYSCVAKIPSMEVALMFETNSLLAELNPAFICALNQSFPDIEVYFIFDVRKLFQSEHSGVP